MAGIVAKNKGTVTQCDNAGMIKATGAFAAGIAAAMTWVGFAVCE